MRRLVLVVVMLVCGFAPAAAHAQTIDGSPLDVTVDGLGGLQATFDGQPDHEFIPGQNGLWVRQGATVTPPGKFTSLDKPVLSRPTPTTQRLTSRYQAGTDVEVTERATLTDGATSVVLEYGFRNLSAKAITFSAAELGAVLAAADGQGKGVLDAGPPRSVGGRDRIGRRVALEEQTAFGHYEVDDADSVRSAFTAGNLSDAVNPGFTPYAAAAQWDITLDPGATRVVAVTWRFDLHQTVAAITTTADHDDGTCDKADCTLREATQYLVAGTEVDLPAGTFKLTLGQLLLNRGLVLIGQGADKTILDGGGTQRLLELTGGSVDVYGVAFTHGHDAVEGGAIRVGADATLNLQQSAVTDNTAQISGGGISSYGALTLTQSLVARNVATEAGGGGIVALEGGRGSSLRLENVTVSDNRAANGNGGGIYAASALSLSVTTIAGNVAFAGGGVYRYQDTPRQDRGALFAANTPADCGGGTGPVDTKASLSSDTSCGVALQSANPRLAALADNGGPTQTRALLPLSPAIDAGDPDTCPGVDQRGAARDTTRCDIGAYEVPTDPLEPLGRIYGNPLDVTADGLGRLQLRLTADNGGAFSPRAAEPANAGLAILEGGTFYPPGSPGVVQAPMGTRTPISGPIMAAPATGVRTLTSTYYVGADLVVTEVVTYQDATRTAFVHYAIKNVSGAAVSFRAGELAQLGRDAAGEQGAGVLSARAADGGKVQLLQQTPWDGAALGRDDENSDVYAAFAGSGIVNSAGEASTNDQIGASWRVDGLAAGATNVIEIGWAVTAPDTVTKVTTTSDHAPDGCQPTDCTLREALASAPDGVAVQIPAGTYQLARGALQTSRDLVLRGAGAGSTSLVAAPAARVLEVGDDSTVALSGVTVTGGDPAADDPLGGEGGGIHVAPAGALDLSDSVVRGNRGTDGGGILSSGLLLVERGTVSANTARSATDAGGNPIGGTGGGIFNRGGNLVLVNATVSGNTAASEGGGVVSYGASRFVSATLATNAAPSGSGFVHYVTTRRQPAAAARVADYFGADVRRTIVAGNTGSDQCAGDQRLQSSASLTSDASCGFAGPGDIENADARLGALAANGAATSTHALLAGSPAIDAGGPVCATTSDQRSILRPATCDIGAFELSGTPAPVIVAPADGAYVRAHELAVSGTATAGAVVTVYVDGAEAGQATADAGGGWTLTVKVAEGDHALTAIATPAGGPASPPSDPRGIHVDTQAPAAPAVVGADTADSGDFSLTGEAEPGAVVTVREGATVVGSATAGADGRWAVALTGVGAGEHAYTVTARDPAGNESAPTSKTVRVSAPPQPGVQPTPTPAPTAAPTPSPVPDKSVGAETVRGTVLVKVGGKFVALAPGLLTNGTEVDARRGAVAITTAAGEKATFFDGMFKISQSGGITTLTLSEPLTGCPKARRSSASAAAKKPKSRKLWGDGKGNFRTKGQYSAATIRGTIWLTQDTCTTTLVKVKQGVVEVNDAVKRKKVLVKAGKSYTAHAKHR